MRSSLSDLREARLAFRFWVEKRWTEVRNKNKLFFSCIWCSRVAGEMCGFGLGLFIADHDCHHTRNADLASPRHQTNSEACKLCLRRRKTALHACFCRSWFGADKANQELLDLPSRHYHREMSTGEFFAPKFLSTDKLWTTNRIVLVEKDWILTEITEISFALASVL